MEANGKITLLFLDLVLRDPKSTYLSASLSVPSLRRLGNAFHKITVIYRSADCFQNETSELVSGHSTVPVRGPGMWTRWDNAPLVNFYHMNPSLRQCGKSKSRMWLSFLTISGCVYINSALMVSGNGNVCQFECLQTLEGKKAVRRWPWSSSIANLLMHFTATLSPFV